MVDEEKLFYYLRKCELEYRAKHSKGCCFSVDWLAPFCDTLDDLISYLRVLGFKIKCVESGTPSLSECDLNYLCPYVLTTSNIVFFVNDSSTRGLVCSQ